jgi:hypothetical protein
LILAGETKVQLIPQRSKSSAVNYFRDNRFKDKAQKPCEKKLILSRPYFISWIEAYSNGLWWRRMRTVKKAKKVMPVNM